MSTRGRQILWALIAGGVLARLLLAFGWIGLAYDIESYALVVESLQGHDPLSLYVEMSAGGANRWPYPPGYFAWLLVADWVTVPGLLPFHGLVHLPSIAADAALAWIVQAYLGDRGADERTRLAAAALVAFGPSFLFVSGYEGQLDTFAILPAVAALLAWERLPGGRRAPVAGLLIGAGAALKTVPFLLLLALLPLSRGRREGATLLACAVAVPLVLLAPWLAAEPQGTYDALRYSGVPGLGGLSLLAQPDLAEAWLVTDRFQVTGLTELLIDVRFAILVAAIAAVAAFLWRRRPEPATAALALWLTVFVFGVNFGPRYLVWALPFMLMAGRLREAALLQAVTFPAAVLLATRLWSAEWVAIPYVVIMLGLLAFFLCWLVVLIRQVPRSRASG
ncbi:MAG: glycosyltransferase 87 family protein [Solirubrobacterales bacterium]